MCSTSAGYLRTNTNSKRWQISLDWIVAKVAKELGVPGGSHNVRAEFYKMLLYEGGAMFKAHKEFVIC